MVLESLARIVKVQLPAYLKRLPLPESVGGFLRLTGPCLNLEGEEEAIGTFSGDQIYEMPVPKILNKGERRNRVRNRFET